MNAKSRSFQLENNQEATDNVFLNAFLIDNIGSLQWDVRIYRVSRADGVPLNHASRGAIKQAFWTWRKEHHTFCKGYGFVIDIDEDSVVVPATWELPSGTTSDGYVIDHDRTIQVSASQAQYEPIVGGILREGLKKHFKEAATNNLGPLWQDYSQFCQMPKFEGEEIQLCRKFGIDAKCLRDNRWALQVKVSTSTIDGMSIGQYYRAGRLADCAESLRAMIGEKLNRSNNPIVPRVLCRRGEALAEALQLLDVKQIYGDSRLSKDEQRQRADSTILCQKFGRAASTENVSDLHLILSSEVSQKRHSDSILTPNDRTWLIKQVREYFHNAEVFGCTVSLDTDLIDERYLESVIVRLPAIRVKDSTGDKVLQNSGDSDRNSLRKRAKGRAQHVEKFGFLIRRPINPVLAYPITYKKNRADRLGKDFNEVFRTQKVDFRFSMLQYKNVHDLVNNIRKGKYDAALVVLPTRDAPEDREEGTHERIKRQLTVPSQCIRASTTLPDRWTEVSAKELRRVNKRILSRYRRTYELTIANFLIKNHWIPFAPAEPFDHNLQIGIDVGGKHNNKVMVGVGYGFKTLNDIVFLVKEIAIDTSKAEPIPTEFLKAGLLNIFTELHSQLSELGEHPDFNSAIFYRDGSFVGQRGEWNEIDAIVGVCQELMRRAWISDDADWTALEVMKRAEGWRVFSSNSEGSTNPLVGTCTFPFSDDRTALVNTTGAPYLSAGTANPLKVRAVNINGSVSLHSALRDLIWQADLGYSKPDMGNSLPWVLHLADEGALQMASSYKLTGITS